jgi:3-methyladenine DNA glycosylase AlkD
MRVNDLVALARRELAARADPERATQMAAYMKTEMPFYGVQKRPRTEVERAVRKAFEPADRDEYERAVLALWRLSHREEKYLAISLATAWKQFIVPESLPLYERLIREGAWWDFVDDVAIRLVGRVWLDERERVTPLMDHWIDDDDPWIRRTAIIGQNKHREATDWARLSRYCLARAGETEFFIRKAIGWALREYSYAAPDRVADFLRQHHDRLSGLSRREAAKALARRTMHS